MTAGGGGAAAAAAARGGYGLVKNSHETTSKPELVSSRTSAVVGGTAQAAQQKQLSKSSAHLSTSTNSINEESLYLNSSMGVGGSQQQQQQQQHAAGTPGQQQLSNPTLNRVDRGNTRPEKLFSASHINQIKNSSNRNISTNKIFNGVLAASSGAGPDIDSDGSDNSLLSNASKMSVQSGPPEFLKGSLSSFSSANLLCLRL